MMSAGFYLKIKMFYIICIFNISPFSSLSEETRNRAKKILKKWNFK